MSQSYTLYIALAYGVSVLVIGGIGLRIILEHRALKRDLAAMGAPTDGREESV